MLPFLAEVSLVLLPHFESDLLPIYLAYAFASFHFSALHSQRTQRLQVDQAALGLSREYLTKGHDDKIVQAYYSYMVDVAVIYGADRKAAEKELLDSLNFEMALANVSWGFSGIF